MNKLELGAMTVQYPAKKTNKPRTKKVKTDAVKTKKRETKMVKVKSKQQVTGVFRTLVKNKLKENGHTIGDLSKLTGLTRSYLGQAINGVKQPKGVLPKRKFLSTGIVKTNKILKSIGSSLAELDGAIHGK